MFNSGLSVFIKELLLLLLLLRSKGQLVADVLNSQYARTGATWRINTKILSTCRGRRHIVAAARPQLVLLIHFFLLLQLTTLNYLR